MEFVMAPMMWSIQTVLLVLVTTFNSLSSPLLQRPQRHRQNWDFFFDPTVCWFLKIEQDDVQTIRRTWSFLLAMEWLVICFSFVPPWSSLQPTMNRASSCGGLLTCSVVKKLNGAGIEATAARAKKQATTMRQQVLLTRARRRRMTPGKHQSTRSKQ